MYVDITRISFTPLAALSMATVRVKDEAGLAAFYRIIPLRSIKT